jgi:hypothetical protein
MLISSMTWLKKPQSLGVFLVFVIHNKAAAPDPEDNIVLQYHI